MTGPRVLLRLEHEGWLASRWEDVDPRAEKRPARRYYRLTAGGAVQAHRQRALVMASRLMPRQAGRR